MLDEYDDEFENEFKNKYDDGYSDEKEELQYCIPEKYIYPIPESCLKLCLDIIIEMPILEKTFKVDAYRIIQQYIIYQYHKDKKEHFTKEELINKMMKMQAEHTLNKLSEQGFLDTLIDDKGNIEYQITKKGKELQKTIIKTVPMNIKELILIGKDYEGKDNS